MRAGCCVAACAKLVLTVASAASRTPYFTG